MTVDAVVRNLEVIGEAAARISAEFKEAHARVEWRKIIGLRNRIVHDYFGIDLRIIWEVVQSFVPELNRSVSELRAASPGKRSESAGTKTQKGSAKT